MSDDDSANTSGLVHELRVDVEEARSVTVSILCMLGASDEEAKEQANLLTEADLRGHPSHGLQRLPLLVQRIRNGVVQFGAPTTAEWVTAAAVKVDGAQGLGPAVAFRTIAMIGERAKETGVAVGLISNSNHLGMLAPYVQAIAESGQIGIAMTTSESLVHPYGGRRAMIGTNPLAIGIPATPGPFVLDMATSEVSMGRILAHVHRAEPIPLGWALDENGDPTTDPLAAANGAISPFGAAKGYALGLAIELLVAVLTQSALGTSVVGTLDTDQPCNKGDVFVCIDPAVLGLDDVSTTVSLFLDEIRGEPAQRQERPVRVPGDQSRDRRAQALVDGLSIPEAVWREIQAIRQDLWDTTGALDLV
jgi:LDH2 family malate/lactate/ureidoglycolate dehydrogenase